MRNYIAFTDDGHDFGEIHYTSDNRAGTRANWHDARAALRRQKGLSVARKTIIKSVALCDDFGNQSAPDVDVSRYEYEG